MFFFYVGKENNQCFCYFRFLSRFCIQLVWCSVLCFFLFVPFCFFPFSFSFLLLYLLLLFLFFFSACCFILQSFCFSLFLVGSCTWGIGLPRCLIFIPLYQLLFLFVFMQSSCFSLVGCCTWGSGLPLCLIAPPNITFPVWTDRSTYYIYLLLFIDIFVNEVIKKNSVSNSNHNTPAQDQVKGPLYFVQISHY